MRPTSRSRGSPDARETRRLPSSASASNVGDLNGDGFAEVIVGAVAGNIAIVYSLASPDLVLGALANIVAALGLNPGLAGSLAAKVDAALAMLEDANPSNDRSRCCGLLANQVPQR